MSQGGRGQQPFPGAIGRSQACARASSKRSSSRVACIRSVPPASMPTGPLRGPQESRSPASPVQTHPRGSFRLFVGPHRLDSHAVRATFVACREAGEYGNRKIAVKGGFLALIFRDSRFFERAGTCASNTGQAGMAEAERPAGRTAL